MFKLCADRWSDEPPPGTQRFYWGQAGATYYLVDGGRIIALLYWEDELPGLTDGDEVQPVIAGPAWSWLAADEPDIHRELEAPVPTREMSAAELSEAHDHALNEAQLAILDYLEEKGQL